MSVRELQDIISEYCVFSSSCHTRLEPTRFCCHVRPFQTVWSQYSTNTERYLLHVTRRPYASVLSLISRQAPWRFILALQCSASTQRLRSASAWRFHRWAPLGVHAHVTADEGAFDTRDIQNYSAQNKSAIITIVLVKDYPFGCGNRQYCPVYRFAHHYQYTRHTTRNSGANASEFTRNISSVLYA